MYSKQQNKIDLQPTIQELIKKKVIYRQNFCQKDIAQPYTCAKNCVSNWLKLITCFNSNKRDESFHHLYI